MKYYVTFLMTLFSLFLISACSNREQTAILKKAETFSEQGQLDSLFIYLNRIDSAALKGEDRYFFQRLNLAYTYSRYPKEERFQIADRLNAHFRSRKDSVQLEKMSHLYITLYRHAKAYAKADSVIEKLHADALRRGDSNKNLWYYDQKAHLFSMKAQPDSVLFYLNKYLGEGGKTINRAAYIAKVAAIKFITGKQQEAEALLDSAVCLAIQDSSFRYVNRLYTKHAELLARQGQYTLALQKLKESLPYRKKMEVPTYNLYKAHFHELMYQEDSAAYYYQLVAHGSNSYLAIEANLRLAFLNEEAGNDSIALYKLQNALYHYNNLSSGYVSKAETARFQELQLKSEIDELEIARQRQIIVSLILAFTLLAAFFGFIFYFQRKKRKETERMAKIETDQLKQENQLLKQAEELSLMKEKASQLREELIRRMDAFKKLPSLDNETDNTHNRQIHLTEADWQEIKFIVDNNYNHFSQRLRKEFPALNEADIHFCCLIKIHVSISDLSNIYCIDRRSVTKKKQRMKEKLHILSSEGVSLDEFIQRF